MNARGLKFTDVGVTFGFGPRALRAVDGVNLEVPEGSVVGLVGESGSGKSTLARAAVGLAPVSSGAITLHGSPIPRRGTRPVQMVFQDPVSALDPKMTIGASLGEALTVAGVRGRRARAARIAELLEMVHLDPDLAVRMPDALSGGQRQRASLARALAADPSVVIADEITSALDVSVQGTVLNLIRELRRDRGLSMLLISHNLAVVRYVSDVIAVMYLGRIVEVAPTEQLVSDPQHPYTRLLLSTAPRLGVPLSAGRPPEAVRDVEPADPHSPPSGCPFHPRCPVGPAVDPQRTDCSTDDPFAAAGDRPHHAACLYAGRHHDRRGSFETTAQRAPEVGARAVVAGQRPAEADNDVE